jgi:WD40 repeat protein
MKKPFLFPCIVLSYIVCVANLTATSLVYTGNQTNYQSSHYVFRKNDVAQGFVRLNNGFTVLPDACVNMDILFSVSGAIDLRETGTLLLTRDLVFADGVTFSSGGNIGGKGCRLILNGDITIPSDKVIHITKDLVVDAKGHTLNVGANAQIFVDTDVTLTLCNMSLTNQPHVPVYPPVCCGASTSKLVFDNVTFNPVGDFLFHRGQLFIHNDVAVTGSSAFIYRSPNHCFIASGACWYFSQGTTLSVDAATITDAPYSLRTTYTSNNFICMADATSMLYLDSCSLQTTPTGCRFTKGTIIFDNNVACRSDSSLILTSTRVVSWIDYGLRIYAVAWHPTGKYVAIGGYAPGAGHNQLEVYSFDGTTLTVIPGTQVNTGGYGMTIDWTPDGKYLAIGLWVPTSGYELQTYSFNGTALSALTGARVDYGTRVDGVRWSPDGRYLAVAGWQPTNGNELQIFKFNGSLLTTCTMANYGTELFTVDWSPDGKYLAIGGNVPNNGNEVQIHRFDGSTLTLLPGGQINTGATNSAVRSVRWSYDGRFLIYGGNSLTSELDDEFLLKDDVDAAHTSNVCYFDGTLLIALPGAQISTSGTVYTARWNPNGKYFALSLRGPSSGYEVQVYSFDGVTAQAISVGQIDYGDYAFSVDWSPNGNYLVCGGFTPISGYELQAYRLGYGNNITTQALSKSIVFGDSAKLSAYDAQVNFLSGAHVMLTGAMSYDNVT